MRSLPVLPAAFLFAALLPCALPAQKTEPQVNSDRTVSFHYTSPSAAAVIVEVEGTKLPMHKESPGIWAATSAPLAPEFYSYTFQVDGHTALDPHNVLLKPSYTGVGNSFLVPDPDPKPWETTAVPHGTIHHHTFTTKVVVGLDRNQSEFFVYTPPGYNPRSATKYPVLYLLHGWSDTAAGWTTVGHANDILDNLIAQGKAKPMIVAMPLGYGDMSFIRSGHDVWDVPATVEHNTTLFQQSLLGEVLPQVEAMYNVSDRREDRAIAGLSMGGLEAVTVGLNHAEQFGWVAGFSSAFHLLTPATFAAIQPKAANLKLLWIACGVSDSLLPANRRLVANLKSQGFAVTAVETPGAHTWMVWRDNLIHFVPLLFQTQ